ncbi:MAG: hypothetical protein ABIE42_10145, partial [Candidatus Eisenbacteria bacterium]
QLKEIVDDLKSNASSRGATLVGNATVSGSPHALSAATVRTQIASLLGLLNSHVTEGDHDDRYYNVGQRVADADTLDGEHASAFAVVGHDHDGRYLRRLFLASEVFEPNESKVVTTLQDRPDLVTVSYNYLSSGLPQATTYVRGALTDDIRYWVTKQGGSGDKEYQLTVRSESTSQLYINIAAYGLGA